MSDRQRTAEAKTCTRQDCYCADLAPGENCRNWDAIERRRERAPQVDWRAEYDELYASRINELQELVALRAVAEAARMYLGLHPLPLVRSVTEKDAEHTLREALAALDCAGIGKATETGPPAEMATEAVRGSYPHGSTGRDVPSAGCPTRDEGPSESKSDGLNAEAIGVTGGERPASFERAAVAGQRQTPTAGDSSSADEERARRFIRDVSDLEHNRANVVDLAALLAEVRAEERKRFERVLYCARAMSERYGHKHWGYCGVEYDSEEHASLADSLQEYDESCSAKAKP
jgi:hypothetical protein